MLKTFENDLGDALRTLYEHTTALSSSEIDYLVKGKFSFAVEKKSDNP